MTLELADPLPSQYPGILVGEFGTDHTLRDLDLAAEATNWMAEPRDMMNIRRGPWYRKTIAEFVASVTPETSVSSRPSRRILSYTFVFWRMLDWACGMDPAVRAWLGHHAGHSITHALRTRDTVELEAIYDVQMRGPMAREVPVAAPAITGAVDYAERLFGFNPAQDIAGLIPFLLSRIRQETWHVHDAVYFLSRAVRFILLKGAPGHITPHITAIRDAGSYLETLRNKPTSSIPSEYHCYVESTWQHLTILEEAQRGIQAILTAYDKQSADDAIYTLCCENAELDYLYAQVYGVYLRDHVVANYEQ